MFIQVDVFAVDGTGFSSSGRISLEKWSGAEGPHCLSGHQQVLSWLCRCASICNEAHLNLLAGAKEGKHYERMGEPTEAALLVLVEKLGAFTDEHPASLKSNVRRTASSPTPFWCVPVATGRVGEGQTSRSSADAKAEEVLGGLGRKCSALNGAVR